MPTFDLKKLVSVKGKQEFFQLTIDDKPDFLPNDSDEVRNDKKRGVLDEYEAAMEERYKKDLKMIFAYMDRVANNMQVPSAKYHELKRPKNDPIKDFEFKHGDLRVYAFKHDSGKIIVLGGYKKNQDRDITRMRSLKHQFLEALKK